MKVLFFASRDQCWDKDRTFCIKLMNVFVFPFGTWHVRNCLNPLMHQFRYAASSFGLEERSNVSVFLLCIPDMSSSSLSSPLNIAWANRTVDGWNCICGERLSVLAGPDTPQFAAHCEGRKHRAGTGGGGRWDRTLYANCPPPPPCWVLARKCRTMGAEGTLRKFCLT